MSLEFLVLQGLNGLSFAALLFLVASGFTLVFGLMRIVNLSHGALYLLGGSVGISVAATSGCRRWATAFASHVERAGSACADWRRSSASPRA